MKQLVAGLVIGLTLSVPAFAETLVVYSAGPKPLSDQLAKGFKAKSGIDVEMFQSTAGKIMARYQAEKSNPHADVMISASWGHAITLDQEGDLLAYTSPNAANVPASLKTSSYVAQGAAALAIAYNPKSGVPTPQHWADLALPEYRDQVTMPDPAKSGSALTLVQGLVTLDADKAWNLFDQLAANDVLVPGANKAALNPVLQGAKSVVFGAVDYIVIDAKQKGENIEVVYPSEGTVLAPRPVMIMKSSQHQDAAKQFVDYLLSDEGQQLVAEQYILPARTDIQAKRPGWNDLKIIDFDAGEAAAQAAETQSKFAEIMAAK
ncbi:ABC transporter substrate-binding protein [Marinobacterium lutimaris]|uniref:Iron(III) transport system substrate-binding protein n=1 Tax=Marinobacterium lutimaris TaxID=568106 RepID=A0A1H6DNL6_9GAMM|nr:ABC transporter substrate-binding protein [Marinobacterium lutimaris]SEG86145.1 iron(III) transport system substrate-binding protein [Marinobacterium lutimaris]